MAPRTAQYRRIGTTDAAQGADQGRAGKRALVDARMRWTDALAIAGRQYRSGDVTVCEVQMAAAALPLHVGDVLVSDWVEVRVLRRS